MVNHVANRIQTLLDGEVNFMMHGAEVVSHFLGRLQVRRTFQTYRKRVQLWPPGFGALLIFDATGGEFLVIAEITDESRPPESSTP